MVRVLPIAILTVAVAACDVPVADAPPSEPVPRVKRLGSPQSARDFRVVVRRVEPAAERACRQMRPGVNCDFDIGIDTDADVPPNAYQTYDKDGRPQLIFTASLLREMLNHDEIAFALAHEAAHHIEGHISQTQTTATVGAVLGSVFGTAMGLDPAGVDIATKIGGTVGARRYSKDFELEADALGARIAQQAGYNAVRGVLYFQDAADPGNTFLGTHPPNADRIRVVRRSVR